MKIFQKKKRSVLQKILSFLFSLAVLLIALIIVLPSDTSSSESNSENTSENTSEDSSEKISLNGNNFSAEYKGCSSTDLVSGAFYVKLDIKNNGDAEQVYMLSDVYVDDYHCETGTGLPVTTESGKRVNGVFIVFCQTPLQDVTNVKFKLDVMDSHYNTIEKSESITVQPNA